MKVDEDEVQKNKRLEKKRRLKERFNAEYDDGDATYFDDLKEEMQKQAEVPHLVLAFCRDMLCITQQLLEFINLIKIHHTENPT